MKIDAIGKDISDSYVGGHLERFEEYLSYIQELGYSVAEIGIIGISVIVNGHLLPKRVATIKSILSQYDLRYTVHAPNRTNLAYGYDLELEKSVLRSCLEFCHEIDAPILVYHSGLQALDAARSGAAALPDDATLEDGRQREVAALRELAPLAADYGVTIGMENGDPHLWEYRVLRSAEKLPADLPKYHARLHIPAITKQLEIIDHPNVGMTLDLAHLHLATHALGIDYLEAVEQAAPWVCHLHVNDNFGKLDVGFDNEGDRLPYGEADLHLPPGWAAIPLKEAFSRLHQYEGKLILEIKDRYWDHFGEALGNTQQILNLASK